MLFEKLDMGRSILEYFSKKSINLPPQKKKKKNETGDLPTLTCHLFTLQVIHKHVAVAVGRLKQAQVNNSQSVQPPPLVVNVLEGQEEKRPRL